MADERLEDYETLGRDPFSDLGLSSESDEDTLDGEAGNVTSYETLGRDPFVDLDLGVEKSAPEPAVESGDDLVVDEISPLPSLDAALSPTPPDLEETHAMTALNADDEMPSPEPVEPAGPPATYDFDVEMDAQVLLARRPEVIGRLRGRGIWLSHSGDIEFAIEMARAIGATHILCKTAHRGMFLIEAATRLYDRVREAGLVPFAWMTTYCDDPMAEAAAAVKSVQVGYTGIVFNVENRIAGKSVAVATLGRQVLEAGLDAQALYYASYPNIWQNTDIPYQEMNAFCRGGFMPLCYPSFDRKPRTVIAKWAYGEHARWLEEWGNMPPLYPVLSGYRDETRRLTPPEFLEWVQLLANYGPPFFSIYHAAMTGRDLWPILAALVEGPPEAQTSPDVEPEPFELPAMTMAPVSSLEATQAMPTGDLQDELHRRPEPAAPAAVEKAQAGEPGAVYHDVTVNDSVWGICTKYGISRDQFWEWNGHLWDEMGMPRDILYLQDGWRVRVG
jgi:hypothetical protein